MVYDVQVVEDTALPAGQEWVLLVYDGRVTLAVKRSACGPQVMAEAWAGYRQLGSRRVTAERPQRLRVVG
jgi:hypothetical protein